MLKNNKQNETYTLCCKPGILNMAEILLFDGIYNFCFEIGVMINPIYGLFKTNRPFPFVVNLK